MLSQRKQRKYRRRLVKETKYKFRKGQRVNVMMPSTVFSGFYIKEHFKVGVIVELLSNLNKTASYSIDLEDGTNVRQFQDRIAEIELRTYLKQHKNIELTCEVQLG